MHKLIPAIVIGAAAVTGCGEVRDYPADEEAIDQQQVNLDVAQAINTDISNVQSILASMREKDPSVMDAHLKGDPGNRTLVVARLTGDGEVQTTEYPYDKIISDAAQNTGAGQTATSAGSSVTTMLASAAIGAAAGYMLASMASGNQKWSQPMRPADYGKERERARSAYVGGAANSYRNAYVNNMRSGQAAGAKSNNVGRSSGGSFSSSGARAGGYAGGNGG